MNVLAGRCDRCVDHAVVTFRVEEMDCAHEVAILERRLGTVTGVASVDADVVARRLRVHFDAAATGPTSIAAAVADTGMRAWLLDASSRSADDARRTTFPRLLAIAALAFVLAALAWVADAPAWITRGLLATAIAAAAPGTASRALMALRGRRLDIHVLMIVAVTGAIVIDEWFEAAAVVVLFGVAQWLETRSLERARRAVREVFAIIPETAEVQAPEGVRLVSVREVAVGSRVLVRPGTRVPLDGTVLEGTSTVDHSTVTGEAVPVERQPGDEVYGGAINGDGSLILRVTREHDDTAVARILHLVEQAQARRAQVQTLVDRFARIYTPVVLALAVTVALVPPLVVGGLWSAWLHTALVLLVISCPCALVIATPVAVVSALAGAARRGLLLKGGAVLEQLARVSVVAFDKTGTLSERTLEVDRVTSAAGMEPDDVLALAASLEQQATHPIARAIVAHAEAQGIRLQTPAGVTVTPGGGVTGWLGERRVLAGSRRWLVEQGVDGVETPADVPLTVGVAVDGQLVGGVGLTDRPRAEARRSLQRLGRIVGSEVWMLSGDAEAPTRALAAAVGIDRWKADLLPSDKVAAVEALRARHGAVLMVGDGVNDGPALATADVGLAMGGGTDVAFEAADGALMQANLSLVPYAIALGRQTVLVVRTNVAIALALKLLVMVLAAAGMASLWLAVAADVGASLLVVAISLRLLRFTTSDVREHRIADAEALSL
jgi:Zn2+/Cd2+-exporting ATPase